MDIIKRYMAGNNSLRKQIILDNIHIARSIAKKYYYKQIHKDKHLFEDICSSAYLGLCQAVDRAPLKLKHNNFGAYITVNIHGFIQSFIINNRIIRIPRSALMKLIKLKGDEIEELFPKVIGNFDEIEPESKHNEYVDIYAIMAFLKLDEREEYIVKLLTEKRTYEEIGKIVDLSMQRVGQIILEIREKAKRYLEEDY